MRNLDELVAEYATEIDRNDFHNFILAVIKECGAVGIREAKKLFKEEGYLDLWDKEVFQIIKQLLGVEEDF